MARMRVGAHVEAHDRIDAAQDRGGDAAQFFLGDPKNWKGPVVTHPGGAAALGAAAVGADVMLVVHAPYVINVATTNSRLRIPSRTLLQRHVDMAAEVGAAAVVVHGGHVLAGDDPAVGFATGASASSGWTPGSRC